MLVAGVTAPRCIPEKRTTFAVCRRTLGRQFLLRPDAVLTAVVTWLLAACAALFDVEVHSATTMSSHIHLVVTVGDQRISAFMQHFVANLAKSVSVLRRLRRGVVFEPGALSIVECKTVDAVVYELAYCIVNPVAAGLVWAPEDWPGLCVLVDDIGAATLRGVRPGFYFRARTWAQRAVLRITWPPCLLELGEEEARRLVANEVARQLAEARRDINASGWSVLGAVAAANASPFKRAKTWETFGSLHPTFATGPGRVVERIEAALEVREFRRAYRDCWKRYQAGETEIVWPHGTYLMRVRHGVRVADP